MDQKNALMEEALDLLNQVLTAHPDAYLLRADKANVLAGLGRNDEARALFDDLLEEHGDDDLLLVDIANLAISDSDYERAADFYVRVVDLRENDTDPNNDMQNKQMLLSAGTWYANRSIQRFDDAITMLDRAANLEIIPQENTMLTASDGPLPVRHEGQGRCGPGGRPGGQGRIDSGIPADFPARRGDRQRHDPGVQR